MHLHRATPILRSTLPVIGLAALTAALARPAHAQAKFGSQLDFSSDVYGFGVGVREWIPAAKNIVLIGSFDCYFQSLRDVLPDLSVGAAYRFQSPRAAVQPYVGPGLGIVHFPVTFRPNTLVLHLLGGLRLGRRAFVELRLRTSLGYQHFDPGSSPTTLTGGLFF